MTPQAQDIGHDELMRRIDSAKSGDAIRRIAKAAHDADVFSRVELIKCLALAKEVDDFGVAGAIYSDRCDGWSKEEDAIMERMIYAGRTFSEVSFVLVGRTRNSCIGRANRIGLHAS